MSAIESTLRMIIAWASRANDDLGQTMAEYGLILAGIAVIVMATVFLLGGAINTEFSNIVAQF